MLREIQEPARYIPVTHEADLVVAGGGTAGIACAVCAARAGLSVIMIENAIQPGGMVTHVTQWIGDFENKGGFPKEFHSHLSSLNVLNKRYYNGFQVVPYFDDLLKEAGVKALYLCRVVEPLIENNKISGVIVESKQGRHAIAAKVVVDATGDGDIAARAGAGYEFGRESDGAVQSISLSHAVEGFPYERVSLRDEIAPLLERLCPGYRLPYDNGGLQHLTNTRTGLLVGIPHVICENPLNADDLSDALIELRSQACKFFDLMKQTKYGADWEFGPFSALPGIRETRRIICDEMIRMKDITSRKKYFDGLFTVNHAIDIHRCKEGEPAIIVSELNPYQIPYRAMLPAGLEGIMVIGRCIGGDHEALASYRLIADCFSMGEAAALAIDQAISSNADLRGINVNAVIEKMRTLGYEI